MKEYDGPIVCNRCKKAIGSGENIYVISVNEAPAGYGLCSFHEEYTVCSELCAGNLVHDRLKTHWGHIEIIITSELSYINKE